MSETVILASGSQIRATLLREAGVQFDVAVPRLDEESIRAALVAGGASPRDMADTLAEMKAQRISARSDDALVIGCDQILSIDRTLINKADTPEEARTVLLRLRGRTHRLFTATVIYETQAPVWRYVAEAELSMHSFSDAYLEEYLSRNWEHVRHSVGCYHLESEGARLFSDVKGDYFGILGLNLLPLLSYLTLRGTLKG